jgi:excisionase family DNA binding protein
MARVESPDLMRPSEVAQRLRVSRTWLYDAAKNGRIPRVRIGGPDGPLRFIAEDIDRWIDAARAGWRPTDTARATLRRAATVSDGVEPRRRLSSG